MLSLVELERVGAIVSSSLVGGRVERWIEPDPGRLAFAFHRREGDVSHKRFFVLDARPGLAHLGELDRLPPAPDAMPAFTGYLRAHLSRARLESAGLRGGDRQLELRLSAREGAYVLLLSIFGRRSNLYLLAEDGTLLQALRPLAETRSELALGEPWRDPASAAPRAGEDRFGAVEDAALLAAIGTHYATASLEEEADGARRRLLSALKKEIRSAARRVDRIEAELAEADQANELQRQGELLKASLARVEKGANRVFAEDFETGERVEIPLDPRRSPKQNLETLFKRYQKLLRRLTKAGGQIETAKASLADLVALREEVEAADALDDILAREGVRKLLRRHESSAGAASAPREAEKKKSLPAVYRSLPRKLHPRRYCSVDGLEIWVGRSDEGNDVLTTRLARGKDLFFHLDGAPGSHVILRTEGRSDPPSESVVDACELAVHFSKQKKASRADVHVVPIKQVKKPRGAKRGLVYVSGGKSIHLRREPERLERLLAARLDD